MSGAATRGDVRRDDWALALALGYDLLARERIALATAVFEFNVAAFPESANVYDSLGEALMTAGANERAIAMYRKSLELDPENANAERMIERIRADG